MLPALTQLLLVKFLVLIPQAKVPAPLCTYKPPATTLAPQRSVAAPATSSVVVGVLVPMPSNTLQLQ